MSELVKSLIGDSYAAPASHILEALSEDQVHTQIPAILHTIYDELWHMAFWQRVTLDWVSSIETPFPDTPSNGFPTPAEIEVESWAQLHHRFFQTLEASAAAAAQGPAALDQPVNCPSPPRPAHPSHVRSRPAHFPRRPQRLPSGPHRPSSASSWHHGPHPPEASPGSTWVFTLYPLSVPKRPICAVPYRLASIKL